MRSLNHPAPSGQAAPSESAVRPGELLKRARERRGLTLEAVALETKILERRLAALERGEMETGAAGFYQRAQARAYARVVGLDEREVMNAFDRVSPKPIESHVPVARRVDPAPAGSATAAGPAAPARSPVFVAIALAIAVVVIGRAVADRQWLTGRTDQVAQPSSGSPPDAEAPAVTVPGGLADAVPAGNGSAEPGPEGTAGPAEASAGLPQAAPEPVAPPPPAPVGVTELRVVSKPAGARVTVNGIGWGETPLTIRHLSPGDKRIRLTMDGYSAAERVVQVDSERRTTIVIPLRPLP